MPFDAVSLELALFLGLLTILSSLPTEPYFHPWHEGHPSYGISGDPYRPHFIGDPAGLESRVISGFSNRGTGQQGYFPYVVSHQESWHQSFGGPWQSGYNFPPHGRSDSEGAESTYRRNSDTVRRVDNAGVQNVGNSYSSHVNCGAANQNIPKNVGENFEPGTYGPVVPPMADVNVENSRHSRTGNSRELEVPNSRIVTPTGGRRSPQGNSNRNQNKPFNSGPTNAISTTEKIFGNQTVKASKKPRPSNSKPQGGGIIFPDGHPKKFIPRVPKCSTKSTFCENVGEEYPSEYITQILKKEGNTFKEFFGKDRISEPDIAERINVPDENSLCPYRQQVVYPKVAQNKEDKWLFVINQDQYVQGITVEVCLNPESRCILTEGFPLGYTPYCKQKYIERRLVAIGEDGKPHTDSFRIPSCCSCVVKHESSPVMDLLRSSRGVSGTPRH